MNKGRIVAFGEIIARLQVSDGRRLSQAEALEIYIGGAETNVLIALAGLGHAAHLVSLVPDNALGSLAISKLRQAGVDTSQVGRGDGRMALYFMERGAGPRPSAVIYDRSGSAFALASPEAFDWNILLDGVAHFHLSGITPALSASAAQSALSAARTARQRGARISFDPNFRPSLWGGSAARARPIFAELARCADLLFGTPRDVALLLDRDLSAHTAADRRAAADAAFAAFPDLSMIAGTCRSAVHSDRHRLSARIDARDESVETDGMELNGIVDRIGGGDAFAAGVIHALASEAGIEQVARSGLALAALKHFMPGDNAPFTKADIDRFVEGDLDVRR